MLIHVIALEFFFFISLSLSGNKWTELISLCCLLPIWNGWLVGYCLLGFLLFCFVCFVFCQSFAMYHRLASNSQSSFLFLLPLPPSAGITSVLHHTQPGVGFISYKCRICNGQHK
jgi:hypothetical protein